MSKRRIFEKAAVQVFPSPEEASIIVARRIADQIKEKNALGKSYVLGLATGSTPILLYKELIRLHQQEGLSFQQVITFNLDEYYPMKKDDKHSYHSFMRKNLFDHIDIPEENINIPDGSISKDMRTEFCEMYEKKIHDAGGIDLQVLGIGRTGHIGFNEPGSGSSSGTRPVKLAHITVLDAVNEFGSYDAVPKRAITMGVETIMGAREIALLAFGVSKAEVLKEAIEGPVISEVTASYLQSHVHAVFYLDELAASSLTRSVEPWLTGGCKWDDRMVRKAVVSLCRKVKKPILKLQDHDYTENGLSELIVKYKSAYAVNIRVFNDLQHTITGWPGGKPGADDTNRPERKDPFPKRTIVFSPHPDDDVISMGGTFIRLASQDNDVHVAYQVSGNIAVADEDVINFISFTKKFQERYAPSTKDNLYDNILKFFKKKKPGEIDSSEAQFAKSLIRQGEALSACRVVGIPEEKVHFLDLPFYHTGTVKKKPMSREDIEITLKLLREVKPHQIFAAGDWADPHGTHAVCWEIIREALKEVRHEEWAKDCYVWLYRGAWQEFDIHEVDMAVPLSPDELQLKIKAIYSHQSQKDNVLFPGKDKREFWQRAKDRNNSTARIYDMLGMAEYEAMEVFARYHFLEED